MTSITLSMLRLEDAEREVADIWRFLEERSVPSPRVSCRFLDKDRVALHLEFSSGIGKADGAVALSELAQRGEAARRPPLRAKPSSAGEVTAARAETKLSSAERIFEPSS
jgi:hypothetical protein